MITVPPDIFWPKTPAEFQREVEIIFFETIPDVRIVGDGKSTSPAVLGALAALRKYTGSLIDLVPAHQKAIGSPVPDEIKSAARLAAEHLEGYRSAISASTSIHFHLAAYLGSKPAIRSNAGLEFVEPDFFGVVTRPFIP